MDEEERVTLAAISSRDPLPGNGFSATWDALQRFAGRTAFGKAGGDVSVRGIDPSVLRAELTR